MSPPVLSLPDSHAVIGLGANLGACVATLRSAIAMLAGRPGVRLVAQSALYDTAPIGPPQPRYRNAAVRIVVEESPESLLDSLLSIERAHGRVRRADERWGPRTLDLDLLLFGSERRDTETLTLPHPRLLSRAFALAPLADVAPELALADALEALGGRPPTVPWLDVLGIG